jgi:hypothetical protein
MFFQFSTWKLCTVFRAKNVRGEQVLFVALEKKSRSPEKNFEAQSKLFRKNGN